MRDWVIIKKPPAHLSAEKAIMATSRKGEINVQVWVLITKTAPQNVVVFYNDDSFHVSTGFQTFIKKITRVLSSCILQWVVYYNLGKFSVC